MQLDCWGKNSSFIISMYICEKNIMGGKRYMDRDWLYVNKRLFKVDVTSAVKAGDNCWPVNDINSFNCLH